MILYLILQLNSEYGDRYDTYDGLFKSQQAVIDHVNQIGLQTWGAANFIPSLTTIKDDIIFYSYRHGNRTFSNVEYGKIISVNIDDLY